VRSRNSYAHRQLRSSLRQIVREAWRLELSFTLALGIVVVISLKEPSSFVQGFLIATVATSLVAILGFFFLMYDGNYTWLSGILAENIVNDELDLAAERGYIWGFVRNIELGKFDIDHLVVSPGGVFAIETKLRSSKIRTDWAAAHRRQALYAASKARSVLRSADVAMPHEVSAVLVKMQKLYSTCSRPLRTLGSCRIPPSHSSPKLSLDHRSKAPEHVRSLVPPNEQCAPDHAQRTTSSWARRGSRSNQGSSPG
jgi:hypothetical protein